MEMDYYARTDQEREFDNTIRESVKKSKSKTHMAMFLQGQEELNLLRRILDNQKAFEDDIHDMYHLIEKQDYLKEAHDIEYSSDDAIQIMTKELRELNMMVRDMITYICEAGNDEDEDDIMAGVHEDAISLVKLHSAKAAYLEKKSPSYSSAMQSILWDYILCYLEAD